MLPACTVACLTLLALASQGHDLWNSENTQDPILLSVSRSDSRRALPSAMSTCCSGKGSRPKAHTASTLAHPQPSPAQPRPEMGGGGAVGHRASRGRALRRHPLPSGHAELALGETGGKEGHTDTSGDQGQALRGNKSSVDILSRLGTGEVSRDEKGSQAQGRSGCFRSQRNPSIPLTWSPGVGPGDSLGAGRSPLRLGPPEDRAFSPETGAP